MLAAELLSLVTAWSIWQEAMVPLPHALARDAELRRNARKRHARLLEHRNEPIRRPDAVTILEQDVPPTMS